MKNANSLQELIKFEKKNIMKKTLLFTTLSIAFLGNTQSLTQANEAVIGAAQTMYVCDSFVDVQSNVVGTGITWDFTDLLGYGGETRDYEIGDATASPFTSDFSSSVKTLKIGAIETFYNSSASDKVSQGFVYTEPNLGDVVATFDGNEAELVNYPMAYGDDFTDAFSGTLNVPGFGGSALSGEIYVTIDGQGTLNLPNGVSYTNVIRVLSMDSTFSSVASPFGTIDVIIERTQYEYYDIANSSLPKLMITNIKLISSLLNDEQTLVLTSDDPMQYLGLNNSTAVNFTVSPNPSTDKITLTGDFSNDATGTVVDQNGRVLLTTSVKNGTTIDVSTFENGMYFLNINSNGNRTSKTIVKK